MSSIFDSAKNAARNAAKMTSQAVGRPPAAVEVTPEGVMAAALPALSAAPSYAFVALPAGALVAMIEGVNLRQPEVVSTAIREALDGVSPRKRAVTLIVPDTLVRVFVLDFDSLPAKAEEVIPVLRFRLRKMVPFDVEHAGVSYQLLSRGPDEFRVLAAILPGPVLAEYESAVRAAGYEPGAVLPSSLAALEAAGPMETVLVASLSGQSLTTVIASGDDLLLYRTIDLPADAAERSDEIQRGIAVAAAYYEDKAQVRPQRIYYAGNTSARQFAAWLDNPELAVVDLVSRPDSGSFGDRSSYAALAGALALQHVQAGAQ